jgi:hypothetical protein
MSGLDGRTERWRYCDDPPIVDWDERIVLGSNAFAEAAAQPSGDRPSLRILLVGHSHDPDLARIATLLGHAHARVEVFLVDRVGRQPNLELSNAGLTRRYDVGYCRGFGPDQLVHFHFDRTLRRDKDWRAVDPSLEDHAVSQAQSLLWGWLARISVSRWVNSPWQLREAENKLIQLACAEEAGLTIPPTLVTNQGEQLRHFAETCSTGVVHKSLGSPVLNLHDGIGQFLYTTPIVPDEVGDLPFPYLFQQRLLPRVEHRVTVIGRRTFTASLHRGASQQPDWRRAADDHHRFQHHQLDEPLIVAIQELMVVLGIQVGAVDLIETSDQTYFLEINPSAAFTWLERALGMHLCQTVTNLILCGA